MIKNKSWLIMLLIVFVAGCATSTHQTSITQLSRTYGQSKIVVMPLDVELSTLTAAGVLEPKAAWTKAAKTHMNTALNEFQNTRNLEFVEYNRPPLGSELYSDLIELEHLHGVVGNTILFHRYQMPLASKNNVFDWSLGKTANRFKESSGADYALFIYIRDSYSSAGRFLLQIAAAALGSGIQGGQQVGFVSLVDVNTGDIVWFNYLVSATGDLRTEEPAKKTVDALFRNFPG